MKFVTYETTFLLSYFLLIDKTLSQSLDSLVEEYLPPNFIILKADSVFPGEAYDYLVEQYHIDTLDFTQDTVETWVDSTLTQPKTVLQF